MRSKGQTKRSQVRPWEQQDFDVVGILRMVKEGNNRGGGPGGGDDSDVVGGDRGDVDDVCGPQKVICKRLSLSLGS